MSLQVWLPLNGDIKNYGASNISTSLLSGTSYTDNGKIGKALFNSGDGQGVNLPSAMTTLSSYSNYSMCAWVYMTSTATNHSSTILSSGNWNSGSGQCCFGFYNYSSGYGKLLCPNKSGWADGINLSSKVQLITWYHVCITYDGTTTKGYINGEYVGSYSGGGITSTSETNNAYVGSATYYTGFTLKGYINDFRIYDNALSVEEIKEISQALVLHYPLNQSSRSKNLISSFTAGGRTAVTDRTVIIQPQTTTADTYFDIKLNEALVANTEYTLSCQIKNMDCNADWYFPLFAQSNPISKNLIIYKDKTFTSVTFSLPTGNTYVGATNIFMDDTSRPSSNPGYITLYNFKLEKGSFATPWCFPGEDLIEYDCSGYNKNGTTTASTCPAIVNDSPRNSYCYSFDGTDDYINIPQTTIDTSGVTFSIWAKWKAWNSWSRAWDFGTASGAKRTIVLANSNSTSSITVAGRCNDSQGSLPDTAIFTGTLNTWYHIVVTIQGTTCKAYKNGELVKTFTFNADMGTFTAPTCYLAKSNWPDGYFNGELSDFRLYATALSADDIARLYKTSASIDKNKALHTYELVEE